MKDFSNASFPPETIAIMKVALDRAVASLPDPVSSAHVQAIAETILRTAKDGERDPAILQRMALMELQILTRFDAGPQRGPRAPARPAIRRKERLFVAGLDPCSRGLDVPTGRVEMPTVLVVEDETLIRELVAEELEEAGYSVVVANDADQAIAILEARQDIHLVFTDIDMPGSMDGLKLAAAVRDRWPPVHIIITTGKVRPLEIPANALFIPKPYVGKNVVAAMRTFENMN